MKELVYDPDPKPVREPLFEPVSYTHLDVYKRQVGVKAQSDRVKEVLWGKRKLPYHTYCPR